MFWKLMTIGGFFPINYWLVTSGEITAHNCYQMDSEMLGKLMGRGPQKLPFKGGLKHQSYRDMGSWQNIQLSRQNPFPKRPFLKEKRVTNFFFSLHVNFRAGGRSLKASCLVGMVLDWSHPDHSPQPTIQQRVLCLLLASYVLSVLETLHLWIKIVEVCLSSIA